MGEVADLIDGLGYLKKGSMIYIIGTIITILTLTYVFANFSSLPENMDPNSIPTEMMSRFAGLFLLIATISLISFIMFFQATGYLKKYDSRYSIGRLGMVLQIVGMGLVFVALSLILASISLSATASIAIMGTIFLSVGLIVIAVILMFAGAILFGIMTARLKRIDSNFEIAGIVYIIGVLVNIIFSGMGIVLHTISMILIYYSANKVLKTVE